MKVYVNNTSHTPMKTKILNMETYEKYLKANNLEIYYEELILGSLVLSVKEK